MIKIAVVLLSISVICGFGLVSLTENKAMNECLNHSSKPICENLLKE